MHELCPFYFTHFLIYRFSMHSYFARGFDRPPGLIAEVNSSRAAYPRMAGDLLPSHDSHVPD